MKGKTRTILMASAAGLAALMVTGTANSQTTRFAIPAEGLGRALRDFARATGSRVVVASDLVAGKTSPGASGPLAQDEALTHLLSGSGLHGALVSGAWVIRLDTAPASSGSPFASAERDIVVTGTRIHGEAPIGSPLTVIDHKAIETSGRATVADYIQTLPQNFAGGDNEGNFGNNPHVGDNLAFGSSINLRGLGTESTLVLFDGGRPALGGTIGAFVDTSLIPSGAIDRIEILTDGASAIYGTDAVAGVVNVRFRDHFQGLETHLYSGVAGGSLHQVQASQAVGRRWSGGGVMLAYQYDHRSRLPGNSRSFWTEDLSRWGGPDNREPYSAPGTITAANGDIFGIPAGQDGRKLTAADLLPGQANLTDQRRTVDILPEQTTHSLYAAIDQDLFSSVRFYARALFAHRAFDANTLPTSFTPYSVPTTNPFYVDPIGTNEPVSVQYDFASELGHSAIHGHLDGITTSAGLKGQLGGWSLELNGAYGHQRTTDRQINAVSATRVAIALADPDPATSLNLFGDGSGNNPATLAFIRSTYRDYARSTVWSGAFRVDGPLFDLPAGTVKLAAGVEHRHEAFNSGYFYNSAESSPDIYDQFVTPGMPASRHIDAVYGELSLPIFNALEGVFPGRLDASLAGRIDRYSDVGRTTNPKAGLSWTITPDIKLRGSWGTSFRAPTFFENAGVSSNLFFPYPFPDPSSPTGVTNVILATGYAPHVRPEKATSWTAGFDWRPSAVPGLTLTATWFDIAYRDRIATPLADALQFLAQPDVYGSLIETPTPARIAAIYASPQLDNVFGIAPGDIRYILHTETQNLSRTAVQGVDFSIAYSHPLGGGTASIDANGTRLIRMDQRVTASSPATSILGTIFNPVRWRVRSHGGWSRGGFSVDGFVNFTDGYRNTLVIPAAHIRSWTTVDGHLGYRFGDASPLKGARIGLSATNLLNTRPPYVQYVVNDATFGYDPGQASAIGRQLSIDMTFQW